MSSRSTLKAAFETGDTITQAALVDLIDSLAHVSEDALATDAEVTAAIAAAAYMAIVTETTTARTLALTDAGKYIACTNSSPVTVTVPPQASVAWVADTEIVIEQSGTGQVTVAAGSGVTINSSMTLKTNTQYSIIALKRTASNTWTLGGDRALS